MQWTELDFVDIEKNLAHRLTDDDIAAVLSYINAKRKLSLLNLPAALISLDMDWCP
jgi:hypothetical protein